MKEHIGNYRKTPKMRWSEKVCSCAYINLHSVHMLFIMCASVCVCVNVWMYVREMGGEMVHCSRKVPNTLQFLYHLQSIRGRVRLRHLTNRCILRHHLFVGCRNLFGRHLRHRRRTLLASDTRSFARCFLCVAEWRRKRRCVFATRWRTLVERCVRRLCHRRRTGAHWALCWRALLLPFLRFHRRHVLWLVVVGDVLALRQRGHDKLIAAGYRIFQDSTENRLLDTCRFWSLCTVLKLTSSRVLRVITIIAGWLQNHLQWMWRTRQSDTVRRDNLKVPERG